MATRLHGTQPTGRMQAWLGRHCLSLLTVTLALAAPAATLWAGLQELNVLNRLQAGTLASALSGQDPSSSAWAARTHGLLETNQIGRAHV